MANVNGEISRELQSKKKMVWVGLTNEFKSPEPARLTPGELKYS